MSDREKTNEQLIEELQRLRQRVAELQESENKRMWAEKVLRGSEAKYRAWFDNIADPVFVFDQETKLFLDCNRAAINHYGYTLDELRTMTPHQLHPPGKLEAVEARIDDKEDVSPHSYTHITKDGKSLQVEIHTDEIEYEGRDAWISVVRDITERKRAEEALRESEEKYRNLVERANDGIVIVQDTLFKYANQRVAEIGGYTIEELIETPFTDYIYPDELPKVIDRYKRRMAGEEVTPIYESAIKHKDGHKIDVEFNAAMTTYQGKPADLVIIRDITARKRAEEKIRGLSQFQESIIDNANVWLDVLDEKANVVLWNKAAEEISGYSREEVVGHGKIWEWLYPDEEYRNEIAAQAAAIIEKGEVVEGFETTIRCKDGQTRIISWNSQNLVDEKGAPMGSIALGRDITERKRMEKALRESEERYRNLFEGTYDMIQSVRPDGSFIFVNRAWLETMGYNEDELSDLTMLDIIHPESLSHCMELFSRVLAGEPLRSIEATFVTKDGRKILVEGNATPRYLDGKVIGTQGFFRDITERKRAEEALQQREAVLGAIALAAEKFLRPGDWEQDMQAVLAHLGQAADVSRALIWEASTSNDGEYLISGRYEWIAPEAKLAPLVGLQNVPVFRRWRDLLPRDEIIAGHVRDFSAKEQEFFVPRGIKSVLVVPIFVNDAWWGFMGFDQGVTEREWTEAEIGTLKTAASILGGALERKRAEEALQEGEKRLETILNSAQAGIAVIDAETHVIVEANPVAIKMIGMPKEQVVGHVCHKLICPAERGKCPITDLGQSVDRSEGVLLNASGEGVSILKSVIPTILGGRRHLIESFLDITERKRAEAAILQLNRELTTLNRVGQALISTLDLQETLTIITDHVTRLLGAAAASVILHDEAKGDLWFAAATGSGADFMRSARLALGQGIAGWVVQHGEPVMVPDVSKDTRWFGHFDKDTGLSTGSILCVPLQTKGQTIGAIEVMNKESGTFDQKDLQLLTSLAAPAATAIETARLYDQTQKEITERKAAEEALRVSEERFALAVRGTNDGVWDWDIRNNSLYWSPRLKELLGYADDELDVDFDTFESHLHPDDKEHTGAAIEAHLKDRELFDVEQRLRTKSGEYRWIRARGQALWDEDGNPTRMVGFSTDITERKAAEEALRESEERFRLLVEHSTDAFFLHDFDGKILDVNQHACESLGYTREELLGLSIQDIEQEFVSREHLAKWRQMVPGEPITLEGAQKRKDGTTFPVEVRLGVFESGERQLMLGLVRDTTERKQAEAERERLLAETENLARELAVLNELGQALTARLSVEEVLEEAYQQASRLVDTTNFYIGLYNPEEDEITFPFNVSESEIDDQITVMSSSQGITGYIIRNRTSVLLGEDTPEWKAEMGIETVGQEASSWLGVPLMIGDRVLGVMVVQSYTIPNLYDEHDRDLLTAIASPTAIAIQNARLFEETLHRAQELGVINEVGQAITSVLDPDIVLRQIVDTIKARFGLYFVSILLVEGNQLVVQDGSTIGDSGIRLEYDARLDLQGPGLTVEATRTGQPVLVNDVLSDSRYFSVPETVATRSELAVPIEIKGRVIGVLDVQSDRPDAFDRTDVALLQSLASQAGVALENARLFEQTQIRADELAILNEMGRTLTAMLDVDAVITSLYQHASRLIDTTNFYVALYHPKQNEVSFPFYAEGEQIRQAERRQVGKGMTEYVIRIREPLLIEENVTARLEELGIELIGREAQSWLGVPMTIGKQVIGVIAAQSYTIPRLYNEHHRDLLSAIANQAAIAIENARLFEETQRTSFLMGLRVKELACLNDIGQKIEETPPVPEFLQWVAARIPLAMQYREVCLAAIEFDNKIYGAAEAVRLPRQMVQAMRIGSQIVGRVYISYTEEYDFLDEESALLGDVVRRVSGYIESRRLFEQIQARAERERIIREISDQMQRATDIEALMRITAEELNKALGGSRAYIRLGTEVELEASRMKAQTGNEQSWTR